MMTPEEYAEVTAKAAPLLEKLVEVLNELNQLSGYQPVIAMHGEIVTAGGSVAYRRHSNQWEVVPQR
jgi:hypothetical protein